MDNGSESGTWSAEDEGRTPTETLAEETGDVSVTPDDITDALETEPALPPEPGANPLDWLTFSKRKEALILDQEKFHSTPCQCFVGMDRRACFSDAATGVLSEEQVGACPSTEDRLMSDVVKNIMEKAQGCPLGDKEGALGEWLGCMRGSGLLD